MTSVLSVSAFAVLVLGLRVKAKGAAVQIPMAPGLKFAAEVCFEK